MSSNSRATLRRRLLLIPVWFAAQYAWNLLHQGSPVGAFEEMTTLESLWTSLVVVAVVVLYANNYQVVFRNKVQENPGSEKK